MDISAPDHDDAPAYVAPATPRRRAAAALMPQLILRFTYRGSAASDASIYATPADAWRWPVPYGYTLELRAVWSLDRLLRPIPRLDSFETETPPEEIDP